MNTDKFYIHTWTHTYSRCIDSPPHVHIYMNKDILYVYLCPDCAKHLSHRNVAMIHTCMHAYIHVSFTRTLRAPNISHIATNVAMITDCLLCAYIHAYMHTHVSVLRRLYVLQTSLTSQPTWPWSQTVCRGHTYTHAYTHAYITVLRRLCVLQAPFSWQPDDEHRLYTYTYTYTYMQAYISVLRRLCVLQASLTPQPDNEHRLYTYTYTYMHAYQFYADSACSKPLSHGNLTMNTDCLLRVWVQTDNAKISSPPGTYYRWAHVCMCTYMYVFVFVYV